MKKICLFICIAFCIIFASCTTEKEFSDGGLTITLTTDFRKVNDASDFCLESKDISFKYSKNELLFETEKSNFDLCTSLIAQKKSSEVFNYSDEMISYAYTIYDANDFTYYTLVIQNDISYYLISFWCETSKFDSLKANIIGYAKTIRID